MEYGFNAGNNFIQTQDMTPLPILVDLAKKQFLASKYAKACETLHNLFTIYENDVTRRHELDTPDIGECYFWLGRAKQDLRLYDEALTYFHSARIYHPGLSKVCEIGTALARIGKGDVDAIEILKPHLYHGVETHLISQNRELYMGIGQAYLQKGDLALAIEYFDRAFDIADELNQHWLFPEMNVLQADVYIALGDHHEALRVIELASGIASRGNNDYIWSEAEARRALIAMWNGQASIVNTTYNNVHSIAQLEENWYACYLFDLAKQKFKEASELAKKHNILRLECLALLELGRNRLRDGLSQTALAPLHIANQLAAQLGPLERSGVLMTISQCYYDRGELARACTVGIEAWKEIDKIRPMSGRGLGTCSEFFGRFSTFHGQLTSLCRALHRNEDLIYLTESSHYRTVLDPK